MGIEDYKEILEAENLDDPMNDIKAEVAWIFGMEEFSDEWEELLEV